MYRVVRHGRDHYRSALIARRDGNVSLSELTGVRAAWVDPLSLGGYLLAIEHLEGLGLEPKRQLAEEVFHGSHPAALAALLAGDAELSAISVAAEGDDELAEAIALHVGRAGPDHLHALAVTRAVPSDALALTCGLSEDEAEEIRARLFPDPDGGRGASALCLAMEGEAFVRARASDYESLRSLDALARRSGLRA
jgi:phosphonate transport system substrate-binding protein